ncbi:MAG: flagellar type III secretion system protein FliR [Anaerovibrio sp.]|uniref:flagellar biosynthetic protein FliR n=1 Tax=Anaerovibrio sp. TaxID=1872532 RepID=UPI0025E6C630|nr:flagellar biosynthetic protein FliR [Anaerovibrio sp.]MCR5175919.1 flagellar type III secretion system protein FliR [Anaerovibrio sp.]
MDFYDLLQNHAAVFLLMMTRISGIFLIAPFFGSQNIPVYFRAGIAFAISLVMFPVIDQKMAIEAPMSIPGYSLAVLAELVIGWTIGFVSYVTLQAVNFGGKMMDMQAGFSVVSEIDPTSGQQNPLIGSFLYYLTLMVFLATNGHHVLLASLIRSFDAIPIMGMNYNSSIAELMVDFTAGIFLTGVKIAMPITFAILLTNVSLGILARTMPQLNIFVVGIPMQIIIGLFVLGITIPFYILFLDVLFNEMYGNIGIVLRALQ